MLTATYGICFLVSILVAVYTAQKGYENIDSHYWSILLLIPVITMGYWLETQAVSLDALTVLFYFINLGTTVMLAAALFGLLRDIGIRVPSWLKVVLYGAAFAQLFVIWLLVQDDMMGSLVRIVKADDGHVAAVTWGTLWFAQYAFFLSIVIVCIAAVAALRSDRNTYSRRTLVIYITLAGAGALVYSVESVFEIGISLLPYLYAVTSAVVAFSYDRVHAHDIASLVSVRKRNHDVKGFVATGLDGRFLSCNDKSYEFLPDLREQRVDGPFPENSKSGEVVYGLMDNLKRDGSLSLKFRSGDMTCMGEISHFSMRRDGSPQGYLIEIRDATQEQRNLEILSDYNAILNHEVAEKTEHIEQIQRKIVLGMANMIENRDNNTGGHVKRTSDVIQILVEEILANGYVKLDKVLARDIVRAAPMHDLGKISIDSSILNKPTQLTEEEYEVMKTHSALSGEMVMILLDGVEEEHFVRVAYNVARYHHERWDGQGYPDGLVGETIPLEARIMAVADVYDTLVSERVYKKPLSFEEASRIMLEDMGTHFDPNMRSVFLGCREKLEQYYSTAE